MSLINSTFNNFHFSNDTIIFSNENLKPCFTKCDSIETFLFNNYDHPVSIDSKYHEINNFNQFNINQNSSLANLHNIASYSKLFVDLQNLLSLLKTYFNIIGISKHKINKGSKNSAFNLCGYTLCFNETKTSDKGTGFFCF